MKILNFGSLNVDYVYQMDHFIRCGETFAADRMDKFCGGKGLNQSVALAKAGARVYHAGNIGSDGQFLMDMLKSSGVHIEYVRVLENVVTGHAIIQVDKSGDNSIILYAGANFEVTIEQIDEVLKNFENGDYLVLQNEINHIDQIIDKAYEKGMNIVLNPSPMNQVIEKLPLNKVAIFMLNEIEGADITGEKEPDRIIQALLHKFPKAKVVLTLGGDGSIYADEKGQVKQEIYKVKAVDTTAAGDTFTGYFIEALSRGELPKNALDIASKASAIAVSKKGASPSIPWMEEVKKAELSKRD